MVLRALGEKADGIGRTAKGIRQAMTNFRTSTESVLSCVDNFKTMVEMTRRDMALAHGETVVERVEIKRELGHRQPDPIRLKKKTLMTDPAISSYLGQKTRI